MNPIYKADLGNPQHEPAHVISDAISNMMFLALLAGGVFVLSKLSWWLGVVPFWIVLAIISVTVVQYIFNSLLFLAFFAKSVIAGFRGDWESFRSSVPLLVGIVFKIVESAIALYLMRRLWLHFYR
jgi:uncharacterized membrane protein YjdF